MKRVGKSPYASRTSMTIPTQMSKYLARDSAKKMSVGRMKTKQGEETHKEKTEDGHRDQIQELQEPSTRETTGTKTSTQEEAEGNATSRTETGSNRSLLDFPQTTPDDSKAVETEKDLEEEKSGFQNDYTQTDNGVIGGSPGKLQASQEQISVDGDDSKSSKSSTKHTGVFPLDGKMRDGKGVSSVDTCADHEETLIMFCGDCRLAVCSECIRTTHKEHDWIQLKKAGKQMRQKLAQYRKDIVKTHLPHLMATLEKVRIGKEKIRRQRLEKMDEIITQKNKIVSAVTELSQKMLSSCEGDLKTNEDVVQKIESDVGELEQVASKLQDATLNCASDVETIQMEKCLSSFLNKTAATKVAFNTKIDFKSGEIDINQLEMMLGQLTGFELEIDNAKQADDFEEYQDVSNLSSRSPRRPFRPLNDFQKCVQCKRMVKNVVKVKYMCGHKICNYCWFSTMNSTRCPHCNSL